MDPVPVEEDLDAGALVDDPEMVRRPLPYPGGRRAGEPAGGGEPVEGEFGDPDCAALGVEVGQDGSRRTVGGLAGGVGGVGRGLPVETVEGLAVMAFDDGKELEAWLENHHADTPGIWLLLAKKDSGLPSPTAEEILDGTLVYGWITGKRMARDERTYLQKITPRRPRSLWSQVNVRQVEALTAAGRMREPGLAEVRAARADGRWEAAYPSQKDATVPDDLAAALAADPTAAAAFDALGKTDRYLVIVSLWQARTAKTRVARLERAVAALAAGERPR